MEQSQKFSSNKPIVALITNCINEENRDYYIKMSGEPVKGVLNPFTFSYKEHKGIIVALDIIPTDIFSVSGTKKAKEYFINGVEKSIEMGARVILLAASTKRLFGDGTELKKLFPNTTFTIGDNGTAYAFLKQIEYLTQNISSEKPILVVGAGILGEAAITYLQNNGYSKIIVISKHKTKFDGSILHYQSIQEYIESKEFEGAALLLGCAHTHNIQTEEIEKLLVKKMTILDVAVPKAVPDTVVERLHDKVSRFDGGDFEIKSLKVNFTPQLIGLNFEGEFYGCFTEALLLSMAQNIEKNDYFEVSQHTMDYIESLLQNYKDDFFVSLKNYGKEVKGFKSLLECYELELC